MEPDPEQVEKQKEDFKQSLKFDDIGNYDEDNFVEGRDFSLEQSSASFDLDSVLGIVFGGFSSRFWVYRKHII